MRTIRGKYDAFANVYDRWDAEHRSVTEQRRKLVRPLRGKILEIGVGTGLNLPYYARGADVTASDISPGMLRRAAVRLAGTGDHRIKLVQMNAEKLRFLNGTFDAVVATFLFCSVDRPARVAREIHRVLKAGGLFVTLGYHRGHVEQLLRRAGLQMVSTQEWADGDRPIGRIVARKPRPRSPGSR